MLEEPLLANLRTRTSEKWRRFDPEVLPLPVAEMDFDIAPEIKETLIDLVENSDTGYLGPVPELPIALSDFARQRWDWNFSPDSVGIAVDVGAAIVEVCRVLLNPGDRILINSPVYQNFFNWIKELHCQVVDAPMKPVIDNERRTHQLDFDAIEAQYKSGVKVHFLCNPHNPLGVVFTRMELERLADLAHQYQVVVISDEIHGALTFHSSHFTPFLAVSEKSREIGVAVTSASKAWNLAGLKCAQFVVVSERLRSELKKLPEAVHFRASLFGARAAITAFSRGGHWLDELVSALERKANFLNELIKKELAGAYLYRPYFGYLGWIDLTGAGLGDDPGKELLTRGKVAFVSGHIYGPAGKGCIRFNYGTSDEIIEEAVDRIKRVIA
jgi:cysteine-S-conjugate beta-lyase